jgi:hypothetical protein
VDAWTRTVDVSADAPRDTTTQKRWYEREPIAVFVPLSVLAATVLQTIAYTGYKLFYNSLGVRPEEVGYDYASLFPRTAIPLAIILSVGLLILATASLAAAAYGGIGYAMVQSWRAEKSGRTPGCRDLCDLGRPATAMRRAEERRRGSGVWRSSPGAERSEAFFCSGLLCCSPVLGWTRGCVTFAQGDRWSTDTAIRRSWRRCLLSRARTA